MTTLLQKYEDMYRIRCFEERVQELRSAELILGSVHLCIGQEAICTGVATATQPSDRVFATYRGHGWALAWGVPARSLFAEFLGRTTGVCQGRGGSAEMSAPDWGFMGENSIVGAGAAVALGSALSAQLQGDPTVTIAAFGEGAMNQGAIHESMNFAAYKNLPLVFVCENNAYSELTPTSEVIKAQELFRRAEAYDIPAAKVDGNDVEAIHDTAWQFIDRARPWAWPVIA